MSDARPTTPKPGATSEAPPEAKFDWQHTGIEIFLEQHFKKVLVGLAVAAVGIATFLVVRQKAEEKRTGEAEAFTQAKTPEDYRKVIANHPGGVAAGSAQLMLANLLAKEGKTAEAVGEVSTFLSTYPTHPLQEQATFRLATLRLEQGSSDEGLRKLDEFLQKYPKSPFAPLALLRKGDALASTDVEKARQTYEDLMKDANLSGNPFFKDAQDRLAKLKLRPPVEVEFVPEPDPVKPASPFDPNAPPTAPGATPEIKVPSFTLDGDAPKPDSVTLPAPVPVPLPTPTIPAPAPEKPAALGSPNGPTSPAAPPLAPPPPAAPAPPAK